MTGDIFLGSQQRAADFQRKTGYVQQEDIHLPTATVREALHFSRQLRQADDMESSEKSDYVQHIIDILEMGSYAEAVVGVAGEGMSSKLRS